MPRLIMIESYIIRSILSIIFRLSESPLLFWFDILLPVVMLTVGLFAESKLITRLMCLWCEIVTVLVVPHPPPRFQG